MSQSTINNDIPTPKLATPSLKHYLQQADWTFSRLLGFILKALIFIFLIGMSLAVLCFELLNIFEYQDGLADVSTIEIIFFISFFVLLKRYWAYTKQTSLRWWHITSAPFLWHGKFMIAALLCASLVAFSDLYQGTDIFKSMMLEEKSYDQLISLSVILLCLYIAVPSQTLIVKVDKASPSKQPNNTDDIKQAQTDPEVDDAQ
ncbi:hypothetical protein RJD39_08695 [Vibrio scophthalmi]|uniref:hypothetical protein n=1 Tax=Vibrio scophthalmi TaxID=45658 RepID=UPI0038734C56